MGAHVYIVGMGVTALMIFTGLLCTSPSEHTTSAFFMQAAWSGVSCSEIQTAFPSVHRFCSSTRISSGFKKKNLVTYLFEVENSCYQFFFIFFCNHQMHNCLIKVYISQQSLCVIFTPTCFNTFVSSSGSPQPIPC